MKVNYFAHYLVLDSTESKYSFNLREFIRNFDRHAPAAFKKNLVTEFGEKLFIFYVSDGVYLFVMTKSSEIIKAINENQMSQSDIYDKLSADESLGFASYILPRKDYFGIGSTFYGPKITKFTQLINCILKNLDVLGINFKVYPLTSSATTAEVLKMPFVGRATFEVGMNNGIFQCLKEYFGDKIETDTDAIEIIIKPKKRKDINASFQAIASTIKDEDLKKFVVKAKHEFGEAATDFYIVGSGAVSDIISISQNEESIAATMNKKALANDVVIDKVRDFINEEKIKQNSDNVTSATMYERDNSWNAFFLSHEN